MIVTSQEDYRASSAVSFSKLKVFDTCPFLYYKKYVQKSIIDDTETKAMRIGSAAHCLMLEGPLVFAERYATKPETYRSDKGEKPWNANAKVCELWEDNQTALGRTLLTPGESALLFRMRESLLGNKDAVALLRSGKPEVAIRRPFPSLGLEIQGRLDWLNLDAGVVVDLKTIECLDDLRDEIERRQYYRQLALYRHLAGEEYAADLTSAIIGIEKAEPMRCGVFILRPELLSIGDAQNLASLGTLAKTIETGQWGGNPETREIGPSINLQLASADVED